MKSIKDSGYYIGCTSNNIEKRLHEHNSGKTQSLKQRRPLLVVYKEEYATAKEAYKREHQIKAYKGGEAFKKLINGEVA